MAPREFGVLDRTGGDGRWQDATILIRAPGETGAPGPDDAVVVIAKHWYPDGIYRLPSGGARQGERILETARREAWEETGLQVRLVRYLLATDGVFYQGDRDDPQRTHPWRSHVFYAEAATGRLDPQDTREIRAARIVALRALPESFHPRLIDTRIGGFRYRVGLEERALATLGIGNPLRVEDDGDTDRPVAGYRL